MIGYVARSARKRHALAVHDSVAAVRVVETMLRRCTDCVGADSIRGLPEATCRQLAGRRGRSSALPPLAELVAALAPHDRHHAWLGFEFLLRSPPDVEPMPYRIATNPPARDQRSWLELQTTFDRPATIGLSLWWPFEDVTEVFLRTHDAIFETLGILPRPAGWVRGVPTADQHRRFAFDRGRHEPPHDDEVGRRLHDEVFERLDDSGARLAYADWLTSRGDPLGEMLVLQDRILETRSDDERMPALVERSRALLAAHGLRWSHALVPRR